MPQVVEFQSNNAVFVFLRINGLFLPMVLSPLFEVLTFKMKSIVIHEIYEAKCYSQFKNNDMIFFKITYYAIVNFCFRQYFFVQFPLHNVHIQFHMDFL